MKMVETRYGPVPKRLFVEVQGQRFSLSYVPAVGQYRKQRKGQQYYFGTTPQVAKRDFAERWPKILRGEDPRKTAAPTKYVSVADLCERFMRHAEAKRDNGEIRPRTFDDYHAACDRIVDYFSRNRAVEDLRGDDFRDFREHLATGKSGERVGLKTLQGRMREVRGVFKFAYDADLIEKPVRIGVEFKEPSARALRTEKSEKRKPVYTPEEIRLLLTETPPYMRAMVWLAMNAGLSNTDIAGLKLTHLDLEGGWLFDYRPKTGVERPDVPLLTETREALLAYIEKRPTPHDEDHANHVFVTKYGQTWAGSGRSDPISHEFRKQQQRLGTYVRGRGFKYLRSMFRKVGGDYGDRDAVIAIGAWATDSAPEQGYLDGDFDRERLRGVVEHIRGWINGDVVIQFTRRGRA